MNKKFHNLIILSFIFFSCASNKTEKYPEWITQPYKNYDDNYFVTVGNDKEKNVADLKAVEDLAGIFGMNVQSTTLAETIMTKSEQEQVSNIIEEQNFNQQILVNVDQRNLIGIEIVERYFDKKNEQWYSLAVLDKKKAAQIYSKEIEACYKKISENYSVSRRTVDTFSRLGYLYQCKKDTQYVQSLLQRLQVIDFKTLEKIKNPDITENRFSIEFNKLANTVPISIDINDDYNDEIINACITVLETYGFKINQDSDNILKVMIEKFFRDVSNPDAVYCEATLSIYLNTDEGRVLFPFNYSGRAAGRENDIALKKEYAILNDIIQTEYKNVIEDMLLQIK